VQAEAEACDDKKYEGDEDDVLVFEPQHRELQQYIKINV